MTDTIAVDTTDFRVEIEDDGIAHVIFQPPNGVPVTGEKGHGALASIWQVLDGLPQVRCILVRSEGRAFCAGGELSMVETMLHSESARQRVVREARELVRGMIECDKPIVSAINGAAAGAGLAVALLADISIAARDAKLIDAHTKLGVAAGDHAAVIWPLLCGMAKAKYYLLLCESMTGEEAERIGLISRCVEAGELQADAHNIAKKLAAGSRTALAHTKRSLNHWLRAAWPAFEASLNADMIGFGEADAREGVAALREKRSPRFE
jgi:enoyl-CoA hydratase